MSNNLKLYVVYQVYNNTVETWHTPLHFFLNEERAYDEFFLLEEKNDDSFKSYYVEEAEIEETHVENSILEQLRETVSYLKDNPTYI